MYIREEFLCSFGCLTSEMMLRTHRNNQQQSEALTLQVNQNKDQFITTCGLKECFPQYHTIKITSKIALDVYLERI